MKARTSWRASSRAVYNITNDARTTFGELFAALARAAGPDVSVAPWPLDEARRAFGLFADAFTMDQAVASPRAARELGWRPRGPGLLEDVASGAYTARYAPAGAQ